MHPTTDAPKATPASVVVAALAPFGLGYFFSYLYRAVNAVVAPDLVRDVGLTAAELGFLTSAYLLAFALFQLPLGVLLDRFGPRRVQAALVATGGLGALLFSLGDSVASLALARAIIGIGFAGGLMAAFKAVVIWVPERRRPLANACVMSMGAIGVVSAAAPTQLLVAMVGWRQAFVWLAAATFLVALTILAVVPEKKTPASSPVGLGAQLRDLGRILGDRVFLALAPVVAIPAGTHIALQTLWVGPWLRDVAGLDRVGAATALTAMGLAFFSGVLLSGFIADRLVRRGVSLLTVNLGFLAIYLAAQVAIILEAPAFPVAAWCLFVMTGHTGVLAYPWLSSYFGAALSGRSNAAMNLMMFGTAFLVQAAVGWIIDRFPAGPAGGYPAEGYRTAFLILLAAELLSVAWFFVNRRHLARIEREHMAGG